MIFFSTKLCVMFARLLLLAELTYWKTGCLWIVSCSVKICFNWKIFWGLRMCNYFRRQKGKDKRKIPRSFHDLFKRQHSSNSVYQSVWKHHSPPPSSVRTWGGGPTFFLIFPEMHTVHSVGCNNWVWDQGVCEDLPLSLRPTGQSQVHWKHGTWHLQVSSDSTN